MDYGLKKISDSNLQQEENANIKIQTKKENNQKNS